MAISDRITSIEEHIRESYQELEGIGIDTTGVNKNLENIPKLIDGYWETLPKVTGEGTSISLNNTLEGKMKIVLKGNTYQDSTTGKNILNFKDYLTTNGATFTENSDGSITLTTTQALYDNPYVFSDTDINVSLSGIVTEGTATNAKVQLLNSNGTSQGTIYSGVNTLVNKNANKLRLNWSVGGTVTIKNLMLELGSAATSYEPYTNGASPNPDYPQDIHVVSGDNSIVVEGLNLLQKQGYGTPYNDSTYWLGSPNWLTSGDDGWATFSVDNSSGSSVAYKNMMIKSGNVKYKPSTDYTIFVELDDLSLDNATGDMLYLSQGGNAQDPFNSGQKLITYAQAPNKVFKFNVTTKADLTNTIAFRTFAVVPSGKNVSYKIRAMIVEGNYEKNIYEPYQSASYPISLGVENLFNQQDFITAMSTHYREIKTIDGVEYICLGRSQTTTTTYTYSLNCKENTQYALSFKYISSSCSLRVVYSDGTDSGSLTPDKATLTDVSFTSASNKTITGISLYCGGWYASGNKLEIGEIGLTEGTTLQHISTTPIELCKIGTYQDKIDKSSGKNLLDLNRTLGQPSDTTAVNTTKRKFNYDEYVVGLAGSNYYYPQFVANYIVENNKITVTTGSNAFYGVGVPVKVQQNETYSLGYNSGSSSARVNVSFFKEDGTYISNVSSPNSFTTPNETGFIVIVFTANTNNTTVTFTDIILSLGDTSLPYEPYGTGWYLNKQIGKVVLNGTESWTTNSGWHYTNTNIYILNQNPKTTEQVYSDKFFFYRSAYANDINGEVGIVWGSTLSFRISKTLASDTEAFKTWLSTHNTIVYYVLATPTYTEITDSTLLSQLNALAKSYEGQTNISQESNDLASILNATALEEM